MAFHPYGSGYEKQVQNEMFAAAHAWGRLTIHMCNLAFATLYELASSISLVEPYQIHYVTPREADSPHIYV